jgi:hypothetical protein
MKKQFYEWIFFRLMGWKIIGGIDPNIKKCYDGDATPVPMILFGILQGNNWIRNELGW